MSGIFAYIDPRALLAALGMLGITAALIGWQRRGDPAKARTWLGYGALCVELLAASMALDYAGKQGAGMLVLFFAVGFIGLALSKATTAGALVNNWRTGNRAGVGIGAVTMAGIYFVVYLAGSFAGVIHTAQDNAEAAATSAPVQALDAQLEAARERLAALAGYADAGRAHSEEQQLATAQQAQAARIEALQASVDAARASAAAYANPDCTPKTDGKGAPYTSRAAKACAEIQAAENALERAQSGGAASAGGYAERHGEYNGLRQHIADLETKRAELLSSGGAAQAAAAGADDRLVAWITGLQIEKAAGVKWLFLVLAFDLLSLGLRILSELQDEDSGVSKVARRFRALLDGGLEPAQAAAVLAGGTVPAAEPQPVLRQAQDTALRQAQDTATAADAPHFRAGGHVPDDGLAHLHKDEFVMPPEAVRLYGLDKLEELRKAALGEHTPGDNAERPPSDTPDVTPSVTPGVDAKRVPPELSGKRGAGRQGLVDTCLHCGADYTVGVWTQTCCSKDCTAKMAGFEDAKARKAAWAKGKKR